VWLELSAATQPISLDPREQWSVAKDIWLLEKKTQLPDHTSGTSGACCNAAAFLFLPQEEKDVR